MPTTPEPKISKLAGSGAVTVVGVIIGPFDPSPVGTSITKPPPLSPEFDEFPLLSPEPDVSPLPLSVGQVLGSLTGLLTGGPEFRDDRVPCRPPFCVAGVTVLIGAELIVADTFVTSGWRLPLCVTGV